MHFRQSSRRQQNSGRFSLNGSNDGAKSKDNNSSASCELELEERLMGIEDIINDNILAHLEAGDQDGDALVVVDSPEIREALLREHRLMRKTLVDIRDNIHKMRVSKPREVSVSTTAVDFGSGLHKRPVSGMSSSAMESQPD